MGCVFALATALSFGWAVLNLGAAGGAASMYYSPELITRHWLVHVLVIALGPLAIVVIAWCVAGIVGIRTVKKSN